VIDHGWRDLDEWAREPKVLEGVRPLIADEDTTSDRATTATVSPFLK
jgi:hypothetical protein